MSRTTFTAAAVLVLAGCASFSPDGGMGTVSDLTRERTGQGVAVHRTEAGTDGARARSAEILQAPLTADTAVELAFLNHRGLQASFSGLGIAEADLVQAGRLRNPVFSFGRLAGGGGPVEIERALVFDVLSLVTMPQARRVQARRFEQAQFQAASDAVAIAAATRQAYFQAVAAQALVRYFEQVDDAAGAASELARRMREAGHFNALARMREQLFHAEATADLTRARQQSTAARERLVRLLGLLQGDKVQLPDRLPDLPATPTAPEQAEQFALDHRLDVRMARRTADAEASALGLTRATRLVDGLAVGYQNKSETGEPRRNGFEVEVPVPLFDLGSTRTARAEASWRQAEHRAAQVVVDARSDVREAVATYRAAYELARHQRDEVVPLRQRISEENLLRYNGMLIGVFDLLADAREQVRGVTVSIEAQRDFWVAETALQTALAAPRTP